MVARKGDCGGTPRVGKKGDPKPSRQSVFGKGLFGLGRKLGIGIGRRRRGL
jgi:hypothetical protein